MRFLYTTLLPVLCFFKGLSQQTTPKVLIQKPFVLGVVEEFQSNELKEKRIINIYLPQGYRAGDTMRYSVIYLLDGSANEDFIHVVGLVQFNNFEWINRVPRSIVVGIATVDRRRDFTFQSTVPEEQKRYPSAGHAERFIAFIEKELQPLIEKQYPTNGSKTLIGQSLGGLLATQILFTKPNLFTNYIIVSPSLWWDNGSLLNKDIDHLQVTGKIAVYIGVGKEGLVPGTVPRVMEVDANLLAEKIKKQKSENIKVYFDYLPGEDHATVSHQAIFNAFRTIYPPPATPE